MATHGDREPLSKLGLDKRFTWGIQIGEGEVLGVATTLELEETTMLELVGTTMLELEETTMLELATMLELLDGVTTVDIEELLVVKDNMVEVLVIEDDVIELLGVEDDMDELLGEADDTLELLDKADDTELGNTRPLQVSYPI